MPKKRKNDFKNYLSDKEKFKEAVLCEYCKIAFDDIGNYIRLDSDESGNIVVKYKEGTDFPTANISEISQNKNGFKFKLYNKETALVRLGTYLGLWKEKPREEDAEDLKFIEEMLREDDDK